MCCSGLSEFLPLTFYKWHLLHEVLHDLLGRDGCCQDSQGSLSLYITLSLISQFYTLSFHGPTRLSTLEGGAVWQDHGEGKQTYLHLYTSYLGEPQNPKLERVWTQNNTSKATVKSLVLGRKVTYSDFCLKKDHVCCCLEKGLTGGKRWEWSKQC